MPSPPIIVSHHALGTLRLIASFPPGPRDFLQQMIDLFELRRISLNGGFYVAWSDVEPYTSYNTEEWNEEEEYFDSAAVRALVEFDPLAEMLHQAAAHDDTIAIVRKTLIQTARIDADVFPHNTFGRLLPWRGFWSDVALVAAHKAGEASALAIGAAFVDLTRSLSKGTGDSTGLPEFFRTLLILADHQIADHFDAIWYKSDGAFFLPSDPTAQHAAEHLLHLLCATFSGWRGEPEGSVCPRQLMRHILDQLTQIAPRRAAL
jgi:hypothetical protein